MRKWFSIAVLVGLGIWLVTAWFTAGLFLTFGDAEYDPNEEQRILNDLQLAGLDRESVQITTGQLTLSGSLFLQAAPTDCAVVLLPGIGGNRTQILPILPVFWNLNCHVLAYDPRGTGASTRLARTFGDFERSDNEAVIEWLSERTGMPTSSIGVWGPSFGGAVALLTLDALPKLLFVIADSPFSQLDQVTHETIAQMSNDMVANVLAPAVLWMLEIRTGMDVDRVAPMRSISQTRSAVLLIHARHDPAMALQHSRSIFEHGDPTYVDLEVTDWGAGHADSALVNPAGYEALIREFLARRPATRRLVAADASRAENLLDGTGRR